MGLRRAAITTLCAIMTSFLAMPAEEPVRKIPVDAFYDEEMRRALGEGLERRMREAVAIHSVRWETYRDERFEIVRIAERRSDDGVKDATVLLRGLIEDEDPERISIYFTGQELSRYDRSTGLLERLNGITYTGGRSMVVDGDRPAKDIAETITHESLHDWGVDHNNIPGNRSAYGRYATGGEIDIDIASRRALILSSGPKTGDEGPRAGVMAKRRAAIAADFGVPWPSLREALLYDPSPMNPDYAADKEKAMMLAKAEKRAALEAFFKEYECGKEVAVAEYAPSEVGRWFWHADGESKHGRPYSAKRAILKAKKAYKGRDASILRCLALAEETIDAQIKRYAQERKGRR